MKINLQPKQEKFVSLLIAGKSITDISEELEINRSTAYKWRRLETVQARYNQLVDDIKTDIETGLFSLYTKAIKALNECLASKNDRVKLETARCLLDRFLKNNDPAIIINTNQQTIAENKETASLYIEVLKKSQRGEQSD